MKLPDRVPGLKWVTALVMAYAVIWIALEGNLLRVTLLGWAVSLVLLGTFFQRRLSGHTLAIGPWMAVCAALGALAGFAGAVNTLVFMALKTGLHAHGPEFSPDEIAWIVEQMPWWTSSGLLAGLGLGAFYLVARQH